ncbi:hypothetical protein [Salinibacter grassmerensis]|uniref:hypothetical protein n=1 Tax=Salinibacter grassmerensis TaxID=3040353 RepID=UPI0021E89B3C|nr:hypothetical protein [Salinibacter grassmerensis]
MGQQQLLLLVLSTVIVGLATVAGIQAFSENQAQASQDALVQRGTSIASDIKGLQGKPTQLGGVDLNDGSGIDNGATTIARAIGLENNPFKAQGAGPGATCVIGYSSPSATIQCSSDDAPQGVQVKYNASSDEVTTDFGSSYSAGSVSSL